MAKKDYSLVTAEVEKLAETCIKDGIIDKELYDKYAVNRGLRDINGNGVLTGLTEISEVYAKDENGMPCDGKLFYRGYDIEQLTQGFLSENRYGFEETVYLLLFGKLPSEMCIRDRHKRVHYDNHPPVTPLILPHCLTPRRDQTYPRTGTRTLNTQPFADLRADIPIVRNRRPRQILSEANEFIF